MNADSSHIHALAYCDHVGQDACPMAKGPSSSPSPAPHPSFRACRLWVRVVSKWLGPRPM